MFYDIFTEIAVLRCADDSHWLLPYADAAREAADRLPGQASMAAM